MNSLRPEDIYCDAFTGKSTPASRSQKKSIAPASRPLKRKKKQQRRTADSKTKVRRNLFGPVDHEDTENFLKRELDILTDLSNSKWNFDFSNEQPLNGPWLWKAVGSNDPTVPSAYRGTRYSANEHAFKSIIQKPQPDASNLPILSISTDDSSSNVEHRHSHLLRVRPSNSRQSLTSHNNKRNVAALQPSIKGFLAVKKRKPTLSLDKTQCKVKTDPSSTLLQIIKTVPPTKSSVSMDEVAL